MNKFEGLLSLKEASEQFNIPATTLKRHIAQGKLVEDIDCKLFGKSWVIDIKSLEREYRK